MENILEIRECETLDQLSECVQLQRDVFALPEVELSPVRHLIVTKNAGGFTLGAFDGDKLAGFVLSVPAVIRGEKAFYSHMTGVRSEYQGRGIGAKLKWEQRLRALDEGVRYIKWTFEPIKARNAHFNLEKLGAVVLEYHPNFYGIDYTTADQSKKQIGLASDRLFAEWHLESPKVTALAAGEKFAETRKPASLIDVVGDWSGLVERDPSAALAEQLRVRNDFETAFASGLVCRGFSRDNNRPRYLMYRD